jgi:ABC-type multidrug transport system fused ATPase/permease subunit
MRSRNSPSGHEKSEYGTFSNIRYIIGRILELDPAILGLMAVNVLSSAINQVTPVFLPRLIIEEVTVGKDPSRLVILAAAFGLLMAVSGSLKSASSINLSAYFESLRLYISMKSGEKHMKLAYEDLENPELMDAFERGTWAFDDYRTGVFGTINQVCLLSGNTISMLLTCYALLVLKPYYAIVTIGLSAASFAVNSKFRRDEVDIAKSLSRNIRLLKNYVVQMIDPSYAKDMRVYRMQDFMIDKFKKEQSVRYGADRIINLKAMQRGFVGAGVSFIQELMLFGLLLGAVTTAEISIAEFVMYIAALRVFVSALGSVLDGISFCRQQDESISYYRRFMDYQDSSDQGEPVDLAESPTVHLEMKNISFKYPGSDKWAVRDVSLEVRPGEKLAIVGLNGAGKTTLIKLITRLYEPSEGEITINGNPADRYARTQYCRLFAPVFQDIHLFAFTVAENVSMQEYSLLDRQRVVSCSRTR